ncbi:COG4223 family protein [Phenylobacterium aquaticum]|uniref:COG4223 family protein n=1 Tax=Phenylobacterium aquaticum TaxID=1763816 RepID=UPI0026EFF515|nr:mitofilin family membrane protein [Phenylobacterium aquaticum]
MSAQPDPAELLAPRDPAEYGRQRLIGRGFWAGIAVSLMVVAALLGLWRFGPRLFVTAPKPAIEAPVAGDEPAALSQAAGPLPVERPVPADAAPSSAEVERLAQRLDALEAQQSRTAEQAAAALAASALLDAAQSSRPFADELAALVAVSPPTTDLRALRRLAQVGAPSRAELAGDFPDYAARAASASRGLGDGGGLWARIKAALSKVVMLRRVGDVPGKGVDATLARAEHMVQEGDIDHALRMLDTLPQAGRDAMAPWRARAERRAEIDRRVAAVRADALEDLARMARGGA